MESTQEKTIPDYTGVACDSRKIKPGFAFVAITGFKEDGNKYVREAIAKGASVVFTEKCINNASVPIIRVDNARRTLGLLAAEHYNYPSEDLQIIGTTGTNGKTTTSHLIYKLLNKDENKSGLIGTVQVNTGRETVPGRLTTPEPTTLQKYLKKMVDNKLKYAVMEVSSHGIKLKRVVETNFNIKVGTNISIDHYDLHPALTEYIQVKKTFLKDDNCDLVLINQDNQYLKSFGQISKNQINYGLKEKTDISAVNIQKHKWGSQFIYQIKKGFHHLKPCTIPIKTNLPGKHNIYNSLVAITIGLFYGLSKETIQEFFESFNGVWRRFQFVYKGEFTIIDDCAHNPDSYKAVFDSVKHMNYNNILIVNSLRGNRGLKINNKNAETIAKCITNFKNYKLFTSNCSEVVKTNDVVSPEEEKIFLDTLSKYKIKYKQFRNLQPALQKCIEKADRGDLILLLGPHAMDQAADMILKMI